MRYIKYAFIFPSISVFLFYASFGLQNLLLNLNFAVCLLMRMCHNVIKWCLVIFFQLSFLDS